MPEFVTSEDFFADKKLSGTKKASKLPVRGWIALCVAALLIVLAAVGYLAVLRPQRAMTAAIEHAIAAETSVPLRSDTVLKQVRSQFFSASQDGVRTFSIEVELPDYAGLSAAALEPRITAPAFSVAESEADYRQQLSRTVTEQADILSCENVWTTGVLPVTLTKSSGGWQASIDADALAALSAVRTEAIDRCTDELFLLLPQSAQLRIAAQKEAVLTDVFGDAYTARNSELTDVRALDDGSYALDLRLCPPESLAVYCADVLDAKRSADCTLNVTYDAGTVTVAPEEKARILTEQKSFYGSLALSCKEAGLARLASVLYAYTGDYRSAYAAFNSASVLHISAMNLAAVRLDGSMIFMGSFENVPSRADAFSGSAASRVGTALSLDGWTNIISVCGNNYNLFGVRSDGSVCAAGSFAAFTSTPAAPGDDALPGDETADEAPGSAGTWALAPIDVSGWTDVVSVCASETFAAGLRADGTVYSIGQVFGSDGTPEAIDTAGWRNVRALYALDTALLALTSDGTVYSAGARCISDTGKYKSFDFSDWTNIVQLAVTVDRKGGHTVLGLTGDGTVRAMGQCAQVYIMPLMQLPIEWNRDIDTSAWQNIVAIAVSPTCAVGLMQDGTLVSTGLMRDTTTLSVAVLDTASLPALASISACAGDGCGLLTGIDANGTPAALGVLSGMQSVDALFAGIDGVLAVQTAAPHAVNPFTLNYGALCLKADGTLLLLGRLISLTGSAAPSSWTLW